MLDLSCVAQMPRYRAVGAAAAVDVGLSNMALMIIHINLCVKVGVGYVVLALLPGTMFN